MLETKQQRRHMVLLKAIGVLIAVGFTLYVAWYELGSAVFLNLNLLLVLIAWGLIGLVFFLDEWRKAGEKSLHDKLDELVVGEKLLHDKLGELITELRNDRLRLEKDTEKGGDVGQRR